MIRYYEPNEWEKKLIAALRSGEYQKGRFQLRRGNAFCCLGVLCDIYGTEKGIEWEGEEFQGEFQVLPVEICAAIKWNNRGRSEPHLINTTLTHLNDNGFTFSQIADIIEAGLVRHISDPRP